MRKWDTTKTLWGLASVVKYSPSPLFLEMCPWWRHQMETFSALLALCLGNSPVTGEFPAQRPVTRSFDVFFDLRLNKRLSKQWWGWWFETPSHPLWRYCNADTVMTNFGSRIHIPKWLIITNRTKSLQKLECHFYAIVHIPIMVCLNSIEKLQFLCITGKNKSIVTQNIAPINFKMFEVEILKLDIRQYRWI